jgi:hypothetical protein
MHFTLHFTPHRPRTRLLNPRPPSHIRHSSECSNIAHLICEYRLGREVFAFLVARDIREGFDYGSGTSVGVRAAPGHYALEGGIGEVERYVCCGGVDEGGYYSRVGGVR